MIILGYKIVLFWDNLQVFKKICLCFLALLLMSCSSSVSTRGGVEVMTSDISEVDFGGDKSFRVGVLLPLSGKAAKHGQGMKNYTLLAMEDVKNPNLVLQFYDTQSTPSGARIAAENALSQNVKLILGPLMSSEVKAISPETTYRGVPVIAFSTDESVLQPGVYTLGLTVSEQVDRIISYAALKGRSRFALLLPDNANGIATAKAAIASAEKNGAAVVRIAFYAPNTTDFSNILKQLTDYDVRNGRLLKIKKNMQRRADNGDAAAAKVLKKLDTIDTLGGVDFDAVLIPESGSRLKSAIAMFGYYDVFAPQVRFLGTSVWENTNLSNETTVAGSWYPALSRTYTAYFANKYSSYFNEKPASLYSFAYDGVALAAALANQQNNDLTSAITDADGYSGISGVFRLFANGYNQHSLDIMQVTAQGDVVAESAAKKFSPYYRPLNSEINITPTYKAPLIFGKDTALAQKQIFGFELDPQNQPMTYLSPEEDAQITRESLAKLRIVLP